MRIEFEEINNGWIVKIKEYLFENDPVFFKTQGQAIANVKRKLNRWAKYDE